MNTNIYLVLGMHRSGTSLVSGLLHQSGIAMGEPDNFIPKPNKENPKGFFENFDFRQINDRILARSGYVVKEWNPHFIPVKENWWQNLKMERQMVRLLQQYSQKYRDWGWKDPRQMLTCDRWYRAFKTTKLDKKLKFIFVYRNPVNVALSMQTRGNVEDITHGLEIWCLYNQTAFDFISRKKLPCFVLSFEKLIQNTPIVMANLSEFIGMDIKAEVYNQFIEQKLVRSKIEESELRAILKNNPQVKQLLSELLKLES